MVINTRATIFNCRNLGNNPSKNPDYSTILLLAADTVQSGYQSGGNWMGPIERRISASNLIPEGAANQPGDGL